MRGWLAGSLLFLFGMAALASMPGGWMPPPGDSGDSGLDSGGWGDSGSGDSGSGDSGGGSVDTADTGLTEDTAGPKYSAAQRAGEKGGFSCSNVGSTGSAALVWGGVLLLAARRERHRI